MKLFLRLFAFVLTVGTMNAQDTFRDLARRAEEAVDTRPEEAVALYRKALDINPKWAEGWLYLGASLAQLKRYTEAREAFWKGIPLAPNNGTAWAFLGLCEYELGNAARALENILKGEQLGLAHNPPFEAEVRVRAARVLLSQSRFEDALAQLQPVAAAGTKNDAVIEAAGFGALRISPSNGSQVDREFVRAAGLAAWTLAAQRPSEAEAAFQALVSKYADRPGVHYMNGIFLAERNPEAALAEFRKELQIDSSNAFARIQLAFALLKRGEPEEALVLAREAAKIRPDNYLAHSAIGRAYLATGVAASAVAALQTAAKLAPDRPEAQFYLEQAYRRAGRTQDAMKAKAAFHRLKSKQDPLSLPGSGAVKD